jgi:hypothetical protein
MPVHNRLIADSSGALSPVGLMNIGAFFSVEVNLPPPLAKQLMDKGQPTPPPITGLALIDTGASRTCIHEPHLQSLGLNPIGVANMGTASGPSQRNIYQAQITCGSPQWTYQPAGVIGVDLSGQNIELHPNPQPLIGLLGRDFLSQGLLIWNG